VNAEKEEGNGREQEGRGGGWRREKESEISKGDWEGVKGREGEGIKGKGSEVKRRKGKGNERKKKE